jgi:hypothetical protein
MEKRKRRNETLDKTITIAVDANGNLTYTDENGTDATRVWLHSGDSVEWVYDRSITVHFLLHTPFNRLVFHGNGSTGRQRTLKNALLGRHEYLVAVGYTNQKGKSVILTDDPDIMIIRK